MEHEANIFYLQSNPLNVTPLGLSKHSDYNGVDIKELL